MSVAANISEGSTSSTAKDQAHFTTMAFGSLMELLNHLILSADLGYIKENDLAVIRVEIKNLSVKLSNLKSAQLKRIR